MSLANGEMGQALRPGRILNHWILFSRAEAQAKLQCSAKCLKGTQAQAEVFALHSFA